MWGFKIKRNLDGSIARYKACLVVKFFYQTPSMITMKLLVCETCYYSNALNYSNYERVEYTSVRCQ